MGACCGGGANENEIFTSRTIANQYSLSELAVYGGDAEVMVQFA